MEILNQKIRILFWVSLALSIGFPAGIVGIVMGAVHGIVLLLVAGILLTVAGFYVMPILWVQYGSRRQDRSMLVMIEQDKIHTVTGLSLQTGYSVADVRNRISRMIQARVLVGYLFQNDELIDNREGRGIQNTTERRPCDQCGAPMVFDGRRYRCEYCGNLENTD